MKFKIALNKIDQIFISHLHGDHYLGLMGLLFSMHLQRRKSDLHIYSPKGLDEIILQQLKYSKSSFNFTIHYHPFDPTEKKLIWEDEGILVETIPLKHKLPCAGFFFKEKTKPRRINKEKLTNTILLQHAVALKMGLDIKDEKGNILYKNSEYTLPPRPSLSYAYCSDTAYHEPIIEQIRGVDLLYHEATFMEEEKDKAIETQHSTVSEAARIAQKAEAKKLLIGHFSARYKDLTPVLEEAVPIFPNTSLAIEGETFDLEV